MYYLVSGQLRGAVGNLEGGDGGVVQLTGDQRQLLAHSPPSHLLILHKKETIASSCAQSSIVIGLAMK